MNIGIDIDNTIYNTNDVFKKYLDLYINENKIDYFCWYKNNLLREKFYNKYLKLINSESIIFEEAVDIIKKLKTNNNNIYIITNRNEKYIEYEELKNKLISDKIEFDGLYMINGSKLNICKTLNIDVMIDDDKNICEELEKNGIKTILFKKEKGWNKIEL